jgi:hypothetical protein
LPISVQFKCKQPIEKREVQQYGSLKKANIIGEKRDYARDKRMSSHEAMHHTTNSNAQPTGCPIVFFSLVPLFLKPTDA